MFITFEANEGAGKSTQARLLFDYLSSLGENPVLTREPGGSVLAEKLRTLVVTGDPDSMDAETELLIFAAARHDHIRRTIQPALDEGRIVICDRYLGSTHALQGAGGVDRGMIDTLHDLVNGLRPDLTLFLDIDLEVSLQRAMAGCEDPQAAEARFEAKGLDYHARVDAIFRSMASCDPTWATIDARGSIEAIHHRIRDVVTAHPAYPGHARARMAAS